MSDKALSKKTAIVIGASGFIGIENCKVLLEEGYQVAAVGHDKVTLDKVVAELSELGVIKGFVADITSMDSVVAMHKAVKAAFGIVTVLINGAGAVTAPSLRQTTEENWTQDIDLNLNGVWRCQRVVQDDMIAVGEGNIINISSVNAIGLYGHPGYSVAKAGLNHLTKFTAMELGRFGIRCNAIAPGSVMTQAWNERMANNPGLRDKLEGWCPQRELTTAVEIAGAVRFLLSDAASHMAGNILTLDGGLSLGHDCIVSDYVGEDF